MAANERSINALYSRVGTDPRALNSQRPDHSPICNIKNTFGCCEFGRCVMSIKCLVEGLSDVSNNIQLQNILARFK